MSLCKRLFDDCGSKAVNLKIHLNCGYTLFGTCNLEVHITVEVLKALNINHGHKVAVNALVTCDKSAGDTCHGSLYRNACRHKCKCAAADRTL